MNLSNAEFHNLVFDVKAYYATERLRKIRLKRELKACEETIKELEERYRIKCRTTV